MGHEIGLFHAYPEGRPIDSIVATFGDNFDFIDPRANIQVDAQKALEILVLGRKAHGPFHSLELPVGRGKGWRAPDPDPTDIPLANDLWIQSHAQEVFGMDVASRSEQKKKKSLKKKPNSRSHRIHPVA